MDYLCNGMHHAYSRQLTRDQISAKSEGFPARVNFSTSWTGSSKNRRHEAESCLQVALPMRENDQNAVGPSKEALSKIEEGSGTESPQNSPAASPSRQAPESVFAAHSSTFVDTPNSAESVIGQAAFAPVASGSSRETTSPKEASTAESGLTSLAFSKKSLAAQRGLRYSYSVRPGHL